MYFLFMALREDVVKISVEFLDEVLLQDNKYIFYPFIESLLRAKNYLNLSIAF